MAESYGNPVPEGRACMEEPRQERGPIGVPEIGIGDTLHVCVSMSLSIGLKDVGDFDSLCEGRVSVPAGMAPDCTVQTVAVKVVEHLARTALASIDRKIADARATALAVPPGTAKF